MSGLSICLAAVVCFKIWGRVGSRSRASRGEGLGGGRALTPKGRPPILFLTLTSQGPPLRLLSILIPRSVTLDEPLPLLGLHFLLCVMRVSEQVILESLPEATVHGL